MPARIPVIAIFDIGKTNKKVFLFDKDYSIVFEREIRLEETVDEDGFPCEDIAALTAWLQETFVNILAFPEFDVLAFNVSAYGASLVHLDANGKILTPLYNYLKPMPDELMDVFYSKAGGMESLCRETASPSLGWLNSGFQLYRLARERSNIFRQVKYSLHLPQYISYTITGLAASDITSIGCHTALWNFQTGKYHQWVVDEGIVEKLAPLFPSDAAYPLQHNGKAIAAGIGLHDSSAALIPYLAQFSEPFVLLSTGTWCVSLNPFNQSPLTTVEMENDCLCYLDYKGNAVKSSRIFAGHEHDVQTGRLADHFHVDIDLFKKVRFQEKLVPATVPSRMLKAGKELAHSGFNDSDLQTFKNYEEAYHHLIAGMVALQKASTDLVLDDQTTTIFVDGGFGQNDVFMKMLAMVYPGKKVFAASVHQASALGAALAIHAHWNDRPAGNKITLKRFLS